MQIPDHVAVQLIRYITVVVYNRVVRRTGGVNGYGTVFEIANTGTVGAPVYSATPSTLVSFDGTNGEYPAANVIADAKGDLLGTTEGYDNDGTVFEITNTGTVSAPVYSGTPTTLVAFSGLNGQNPQAGLIADTKGDLFGTTVSGGRQWRHGLRDRQHGHRQRTGL